MERPLALNRPFWYSNLKPEEDFDNSDKQHLC